MAYNGETMAKRAKTEIMDTSSRDFDYKSNYDSTPLRRKRPEAEPNNVLLFTIINPLYPITVDVLHTICTPQASVLRIVIFKKNGVQAMIEFETVDAARTVKDALNGADIYSGCCTLKIEFAKPNKLNVFKNDQDSWDYTINNNEKVAEQQQTPRQAPLLQDPRPFSSGPTPYRGSGGGGPPYMEYDDGFHQNGPAAYGDHYMGPERYPPPPERFMKQGGARESLMAPPARGGGPGYAQGMNTANGQAPTGSVMMAYGLEAQKANCDKLFNLFCLYGNVIRIKFLKTKEGCAMVQMGDGVSVDRCIHHLKNAPLLGSTLQLGFSKQAFLSEVAHPYLLPDQTPSFKDFSASKNNRFLNPAMASKNRIQGPAKILHFFNTPPNVTEEELMDAMKDTDVKLPSVIKLFPKKDRSSSGLMEFDEIADAINALVYCNHLQIKCNEAKFPYVMKLCFSSTRSIQSYNGTGKDD